MRFNGNNSVLNTGGAHIDKDNVAENWLGDDQVSAMNVGGNGPVTRNEVYLFGS